MIYSSLCPEKGYIFRIVHRSNLPWLLDNGLHSGNGHQCSPNWVNIGNAELISKRASHPVPLAPFGVLHDYVPFYFTPFSPMARNINTGWAGIQQRNNDEILILVSDLYRIQHFGLEFVFTDSHAYYRWANFYNNLNELEKIDWGILQRRDFARDDNDPGKFERYQAEALIYRHCPVQALSGIFCYNSEVTQWVDDQIKTRNLQIGVKTGPGWYF